MNKHLKLFANHSAYSQAESNLDKPNVVVCQQEGDVHFNPYIETRIIAKYNVTDTESSTKIINDTRNIGNVEIDGIQQSNVISSYKFSTTGEHIVKFSMNSGFYKNEIYNNQFNSVSSLISITIPINITQIDDYAFRSCTNLININLPNTITKIKTYAFDYCTNLTSIILPDSITSIGDYAFRGSGLTNITIPNNITTISTYTFVNCTSLTTIIIPNNIRSIRDYAFQSCTSLNSIIIPDSVTSIGTGILYECSNLANITINAINPPTLRADSVAFYNTNNCPIYVPSESVNAYKTATGWTDYANRIQAIS